MSLPIRVGATCKLAYFTLLCCISVTVASAATPFPPDLFGYTEVEHNGIDEFPLWVDVLARHLTEDVDDGDCDDPRFNRCHLARWRAFLASIENQPRREQIEAVNRYANQKDYILDIDNYGVIDYWAIPREFLFNGGDCEDYAITKMMSLRWLGYSPEELRIVVLQDTNLRIAHAVMAIGTGDDILILDNQVEQVLSHHRIVHYAPVYSIGESHWWMHLPRS